MNIVDNESLVIPGALNYSYFHAAKLILAAKVAKYVAYVRRRVKIAIVDCRFYKGGNRDV